MTSSLLLNHLEIHILWKYFFIQYSPLSEGALILLNVRRLRLLSV